VYARIQISGDDVILRDQRGLLRVILQQLPDRSPVGVFYDGHGAVVGGLTFGPDGRLIVTMSEGNGRPGLSVLLHQGRPFVVCFPDGADPLFFDVGSGLPLAAHHTIGEKHHG